MRTGRVLVVAVSSVVALLAVRVIGHPQFPGPTRNDGRNPGRPPFPVNHFPGNAPPPFQFHPGTNQQLQPVHSYTGPPGVGGRQPFPAPIESNSIDLGSRPQPNIQQNSRPHPPPRGQPQFNPRQPPFQENPRPTQVQQQQPFPESPKQLHFTESSRQPPFPDQTRLQEQARRPSFPEPARQPQFPEPQRHSSFPEAPRTHPESTRQFQQPGRKPQFQQPGRQQPGRQPPSFQQPGRQPPFQQPQQQEQFVDLTQQQQTEQQFSGPVQQPDSIQNPLIPQSATPILHSRPPSDFSAGFPSDFTSGLPNFNFNGPIPDGKQAASSNVEGFFAAGPPHGFPSFQSIGGFGAFPELSVRHIEASTQEEPEVVRPIPGPVVLQHPANHGPRPSQHPGLVTITVPPFQRSNKHFRQGSPISESSENELQEFPQQSHSKYLEQPLARQKRDANVTSVSSATNASSTERRPTTASEEEYSEYDDSDMFMEDPNEEETRTEPSSGKDNDPMSQHFFPSFAPAFPLGHSRPLLFPEPSIHRPPPPPPAQRSPHQSPPPFGGFQPVRGFGPFREHSNQYQQHAAAAETNILGSGNFGVIRGGTYYDDEGEDYNDNNFHNFYHSHNGHGRPSYYARPSNPRPHGAGGNDFFANFRDFADINAPKSFSEYYVVYVNQNASKSDPQMTTRPKNIIEQLRMLDDEDANKEKKENGAATFDVSRAKAGHPTKKVPTESKMKAAMLEEKENKRNRKMAKDFEPLLALS